MSLLVIMLQTEMYQPLYNQSVAFAVPSPAASQFKYIGILMTITGAASIVLNIIGLSYWGPLSNYGHGFWCGVMVSSCMCFMVFFISMPTSCRPNSIILVFVLFN